MRRPSHGLRLGFAAALVLLAPASVLAQDDSPRVLVVELSGAVTPVIADHIEQAVQRATDEANDAVLVVLDTPGGLDTSMREVVRTFLNSRVPVVVWVAPPGARAASAGAVIVLASHVAAMAPGTNIGAATPVSIEGGDLGDKIVNDATAYVVAIAQRTGRDEGFARDIVRKGRSEPASTALRIGAADIVEADRDRLLERIHGRTVTIGGEKVELRTKGATIVTHELGFVNRVRQYLADPNLAFLFMSLGTLAIVYELANPGIGLGGIAGVILIVLALFALSVLPVNAAGIAFLILALGLFVAELFVPGVGVMAAGGTVALVLAGLFLVRGDQRVALTVLLPTAIVMFGAVMIATRLVWRTRRTPPVMGMDALRGRTARIRRAGDGTALGVMLEGAWWSVRSDELLEEGQTVRVTATEGLELIVEPATSERNEVHE
jgi:membrane-bound serine protease (ClpP class)